MFWLHGRDFEFEDAVIFRRAFQACDLDGEEAAGLTAGLLLIATHWDADAAQIRAHAIAPFEPHAVRRFWIEVAQSVPKEAQRNPSIRIAEVSAWALLTSNFWDADAARIDALGLEVNGATLCGPFWEAVRRRIWRLQWQGLPMRIAKDLTAREDSHRSITTARLRENVEIESRRRGYWGGYAAPDAVALYLYRMNEGCLDRVMRALSLARARYPGERARLYLREIARAAMRLDGEREGLITTAAAPLVMTDA